MNPEARPAFDVPDRSCSGSALYSRLPDPGARVNGPSFQQWLTGQDAAVLAL